MDERQFIFEIRNQSLKWKFYIYGGAIIVGTVITHVATSYGIPITLKVKSGNEDVREIPWTSIQYITYVGEI